MASIICVPLFGIGALGVDLGLVFANQASLRAATDAAALAAVLDLSRASSIAGKSLTTNSWSSAASSVSTGLYCPDPGLAVASRYTAGGTACALDQYTQISGTNLPISGPNAVKVTTSSAVPLTLARVLTSATQLPIRASATATRIDMAGFYAGTGLVSLNGGIENALLSQLLGTSISLTAVQYNGLLNANVTALSFLKALATQVGVSAGTYSSLASSSVTFGQLARAAVTVLNQSGGSGSAGALSGLQALLAQAPVNQAIPLARLMDLQPYLNDQIGGSPPAALNAGINVYNLVSFASQLIGADRPLTIPTNGFTGLSLGVPGVASVSAVTSIIEPPQSPYFGFGPVGATVHTAQVRLGVTVTVLSTALLPANLANVTFQLPLYIELASGTATLTSIACSTNPPTMTVTGQPNLAQVSLGTVNGPATPASPVMILSANVLGGLLGSIVGGVEVDGSANLVSGSGSAQAVTFTQPETQQSPPVVKSVTSNSAMTSTLISSLGSSVSLTAKSTGLLGGLLGGVAGVESSVLTTLTGTVLPVLDGLVDPLIGAVLNVLGIKLGYIDIVGTGIRCGVPVLVQ